MTFWIAGAGVGIVGGFAALVVTPIAIVPELIVVLALAAARPRLFGLAGALVGHGLVWSWLLATSSVACLDSLPPQCSWSLPFGPAHLTDSSAWQTETRLWFLAALFVLFVGFALTLVAARQKKGRRQLLA